MSHFSDVPGFLLQLALSQSKCVFVVRGRESYVGYTQPYIYPIQETCPTSKDHAGCTAATQTLQLGHADEEGTYLPSNFEIPKVESKYRSIKVYIP